MRKMLVASGVDEDDIRTEEFALDGKLGRESAANMSR
jgi:hypothetical protein